MASRTQNITVDVGADYVANVVAYANGSTTTVLNLTNCTANAAIKKGYYHSSTSATFNVWIQDASAGIINIHLNAANTNTMTPGNYVYDVIVLNSSTSHRTRVIEGIATVTAGVAK